MQELHNRLIKDIKSLGIDVNFELVLKSFSKVYFGNYRPDVNRITLYVYQDEECTILYPYKEILITLLHEAVHCIQSHDPDWVRYKGVMHDSQFYRIFEFYKAKLNKTLFFQEVKNAKVKVFKKPLGEVYEEVYQPVN